MANSIPPASEQSALSVAQLHQLATLSGELADAPGLPTFVARLARGLGSLAGFDQVALAMKAPDGKLWGLLQPRAAAEEPGWQDLSGGPSPLLEALTTNRPVLRSAPGGLTPRPAASQVLQTLTAYASAICLPVRGPDGPLGALGLFAMDAGEYAVADLHLLAVIAAIAESLARRLVLTEEAARLDGQVQHTVRYRREVVESLAQEVWSPLSVLDNGLDFLQSSLLPPGPNQAREQVDELRLVAGTLVEMVENLIELSRMDERTLESRPEPVSVDGFLRERLETHTLAARIGEAKLTIRCDPPNARATIDARLLGRVVDNLLLNALRHTPRMGEIALVAVARPQGFTLAVADSGSAVAPQDRDTLLSRGPWERPDRAPSRAFGLGYARSAIEYLGGTLSIEAPPGAGNLFRVTLPG